MDKIKDFYYKAVAFLILNKKFVIPAAIAIAIILAFGIGYIKGCM